MQSYGKVRRKSIQIAERLAEGERALETAKRFIPDMFEGVERRLKATRKEAERDGLAMEFLPQARIVVSIRAKRDEILRGSFLNELNAAALAERDRQRSRLPKTRRSKKFFGSFFANKAWRKFISAIEKGRVAAALEAFGDLMDAVSFELIYKINLPSIPKYSDPEIKAPRV